MRRTEHMKQLESELKAVREKIMVLQGQEAMLERLLNGNKGETEQRSVRKRAPRSNVKQAVLGLLAQVGADGLNAALAVEMGGEQGQDLDRGSVSSLLSRLKNDGVVTYVDGRYRLAEFNSHPTKDEKPRGEVHPLRVSGAAS